MRVCVLREEEKSEKLPGAVPRLRVDNKLVPNLLVIDLYGDVRIGLSETLCDHLGQLDHERLLGVGVTQVRIRVDREARLSLATNVSRE